MFFCFSLCSLLVLLFYRCVQVWNVVGIFRLNSRGSSAHGFFGEKHCSCFQSRWYCSFLRMEMLASSNHVCHFPPNPFQVAVYLQCLLNEAYSPSSVLNTVYSIDWALQLAGLSKISSHPLVASMVSASQPEILKAVVESKITDKSPSREDKGDREGMPHTHPIP